MFIKSLVIEQEGKEIVSADENGVITYAEGYDAEKVMDVMVKWGAAQIPKGPETADRYGMVIMLGSPAAYGESVAWSSYMNSVEQVDDTQDAASAFRGAPTP